MSNQPAYGNKIDLSAFKMLCSQTALLEDYPLAKAVEKNIFIYGDEGIKHQLDGTEK